MDYTVIRSDRKTVALQINQDGELIVRVPKRFPKYKINKLVEKHREWIEKKTAEAVSRKENTHELSAEEISELKNRAREILPKLTEKYAKIMGVSYGTVKITSAQKRFGSCSAKNNICYSYILMQYPIEAIEYVVVHELAHTVHHDHSKAFYALIEKYMPDYKQREKLLKTN
ncbi:MAG: M48 family metallopeptidase [Acutalibacteraceae bacterium]